MKIYKQPKFHPAKCPCCGTVFEIEDNDTIRAEYEKDFFENYSMVRLYAECPICQCDEVPLEKEGMIGRY